MTFQSNIPLPLSMYWYYFTRCMYMGGLQVNWEFSKLNERRKGGEEERVEKGYG